MGGMLKLPAVGHPQTKDANKITNLVVANLPEVAHVSAPDHAGQMVIDESQHLESDVVRDTSLIPHVVVSKTAHARTAVSHTWQNDKINVIPLEHVAIPWMEL